MNLSTATDMDTTSSWKALATDFDGTLAEDGLVLPEVYEAVSRARTSGLKVILVTGRELRDFELLQVDLRVFDHVVAENGAVLYEPATGVQTLLAPAPSQELVEMLQENGVDSLSVGLTIIATCVPHEIVAVECIKALGLELTITFNKGAVMILPPGVNKASGLKAALKLLNLNPGEVVGVGDAENDHAFLSFCGCAVAVDNALPR
ncbi:HAD superfamily hydrolase (TIGR01484 family) [Roseimicrobium gellanilyticum]|uniref:HAD superfamily hydrolase (TIGR01484 family) n=1 Tax=Roseimicrobium gellanilyticum TaxID=748857 RepID=A0A366HI25_9BACT|nr:HAD-IIB family hydrolase [Roseimicrobium gellanilyticum]RBP42417.1 HAD superfamily hydrolase (TIGR01484 family) [Roseimicrobium gellanilyticum]